MKNIKKLITWVLAFKLVSAFSEFLMQDSLRGWYYDLARSPLTPPGVVFGVVWGVVYVMIAAAGWMLWEISDDKGELNTAKAMYLLQVVCNWSWTPLFFYFQSVVLGFLALLLTAFYTAGTIFYAYDKARFSSQLLMPYLAWLLFALYLNLYMFLNN